jgi:response regulator RpfG family c-di-GMP phosphodiesterase
MAKILIVEDETTLAETLAENLSEEGYEVLTADNGETGLALIRSELPDLIVRHHAVCSICCDSMTASSSDAARRRVDDPRAEAAWTSPGLSTWENSAL